jgi:hypothetical protein
MSNKLIAVLLMVPSIVIFSEASDALLKVLFDKTGFPDLYDKCLFIWVFFY